MQKVSSMRIRKRFVPIILLVLFLFSACGKASRPADQIIGEIVTFYGCYGSEADDKVSELLRELSRTDKAQGKLWADIVQYWAYVNNDMVINETALPDDLPKDDTLVLVVLGYALNADGTMQDELLERLKTAKRCAEQYPNAYVLCTGGATASLASDATEGERMGEWLLANGLEPERLIVENRSRTTAENAEFSYQIFRKDYPQIQTAAIISSGYHIPWGALMFEAMFLKSAAEEQTEPLHVAANCACPVENPGYDPSNQLRWEASGLFQMFDMNAAASQYYAIYSGLK